MIQKFPNALFAPLAIACYAKYGVDNGAGRDGYQVRDKAEIYAELSI